ncbi:CRAL/TRIO domain [Popillia japonica]|uniref:CRAL/TRIO domain n=1 Tax=Popillia japonica TaxID=7064 RepID=A0AAW1ML11_POPJA
MTELMFKPDETETLKMLNIEEEKLNHYYKLFTEWISSQKHLPQSYNETCLKKFLVWAKMDFEKAKKKFTKFCYNTITYKEFLCNRIVTLDGDLKSSKFVYLLPMRGLTPEGYRVFVVKIFDPDNFDILEMTRTLALCLDYRIHQDGMVAGEIGIFDMNGMRPHHYAKMFTPTFFKFAKFGTPTFFKFAKFGLLNLPFLVKHVLIINCHPVLEKGFAALRAILPKKIGDRFVALSNPNDLAKYIPPDCLPEELGGTDLTVYTTNFATALVAALNGGERFLYQT